MNLRSLLYRTASLLGDLNAVKKNKVPERIIRKKAIKLVNKKTLKFLDSLLK